MTPMDVNALLLDLYGRIPPLAREAVEGLEVDRLVEQPAPGANPIAWLIWHLARVQDAYLSEFLGDDQVWTGGDWAARFGLEPDPMNHGYGHSEADVRAVRPESAEVLLGYLDAIDERMRAYLAGLTEADLDRIVDESYDPPVSLGTRLISIADDGLQHVGQAAYLRGLLDLLDR
jgi:uncharacterized damage-inducible protein DinB